MIYILCPDHHASGGPEALHQLFAALRSFDADVRMVYVGKAREWMADGLKSIRTHPQIPERFQIYHPRFTSEIVDDPAHVLIVPESINYYRAFDGFPRIRKVLWWLSVGFHSADDTFNFAAPEYPGVQHLWQSAFAREWLLRQGAGQVFPLTDYLSDPYLSAEIPLAPREPRIVYNPKKWRDRVRPLTALVPEAEWVGMEGLDAAGCIALLSTSKLYIDFGFHPGKDRIPREAALCGTVVLTGQDGAAVLAEDVPLPPSLKLPYTPDMLPAIAQRIREILANFDTYSALLDPWRHSIRQEKYRFFQEVQALLDVWSPR